MLFDRTQIMNSLFKFIPATQLGGLISQDEKPIFFWSSKLTSEQQQYSNIKREILAVVEMLKDYRNILLRHELFVYTDHEISLFQILQIGKCFVSV